MGKVDLRNINLKALEQELGVDIDRMLETDGINRAHVRVSKPRKTAPDMYIYVTTDFRDKFITLYPKGSMSLKERHPGLKVVGFSRVHTMEVIRKKLSSIPAEKAKVIQAALSGEGDSKEIRAMREWLFQPSERHVSAMIELLDAKAKEGRPIDHKAVMAEFANKYRSEISPNFAEACFDAAMVKTMKDIHTDLRSRWAQNASDNDMKNYVIGHAFAKYPFKEKVQVMIGDELRPGWDNSARKKLYELYEQI